MEATFTFRYPYMFLYFHAFLGFSYRLVDFLHIYIVLSIIHSMINASIAVADSDTFILFVSRILP